MIEFKSPLYSEFSGELEGLVRFLDYGNEKLARRERELTLQHFHKMHPCCPPEVMREGLNFVTERSKAGRVVYPLYELSECRDEERKKEVRLFAFSSEESTKKPAVPVSGTADFPSGDQLLQPFSSIRSSTRGIRRAWSSLRLAKSSRLSPCSSMRRPMAI